MFYRVTIFFLLLGLSQSFAESSVTTNGVYLVIGGHNRDFEGVTTNRPLRFDDPLMFMPFCDTGKIELSYSLDPAYGIKVKMVDASGKDVPKTSLGKRFGSKYDRLHNLKDTRLYPFTAWGSFKDNSGLGGARFFYDYPASGADKWLAPKDLFKMEKPGSYTMEVQMQMFYFNPHSTNAYRRDLFQFSPVKIKVEKPEEK